MPLPLILAAFIAIAIAGNRIHYGGKPVVVPEGQVIVIDNASGRWTVSPIPEGTMVPQEPELLSQSEK